MFFSPWSFQKVTIASSSHSMFCENILEQLSLFLGFGYLWCTHLFLQFIDRNTHFPRLLFHSPHMLAHSPGCFFDCFCCHFINSRFCYFIHWIGNLIIYIFFRCPISIFVSSSSSYQLLEKPRIQFRALSTGFFWSLSWAVMAQNEILSPHSQMTNSDPKAWSSPLAAESMIGLFDIVRLHSGHLIWFSIFFPFFESFENWTQQSIGLIVRA